LSGIRSCTLSWRYLPLR